jgi:hypothetical protein
MSTTTTDLRAPAVSRPAALRAADGVVAGYIHSLSQAAAKPAASATPMPALSRLAKHAYECGASRSSGLATRRRSARLRVPSPA